MSDIFDQIRQKIDKIREITHASDRLEIVMNNPYSNQEDFDEAIKQGIETLNEIENRSKSQ